MAIELTGVEDAIANLKGLARDVQRRGVRLAMAAAVRPIARAIKAAAGKKSGATRKAIGSKIRIYASGVTAGIVGVQTKKAVQLGTRKKGKHIGQPIIHDPNRIAPILVKRGHFPIEQAAAGAKDAASAVFTQKIADFVEREAAKARS